MEVSEAEASFRARARAMWWAGGAVLSGALVLHCQRTSSAAELLHQPLTTHTPPSLVFMQPLGHEYIGSTTKQSSIGLIQHFGSDL